MSAVALKQILQVRSKVPATKIRIRDGTEADLPAIVEIHNAAIASRLSTAQLEPVTVEGRRDWFRAHSPTSYPIWVAEVEGVIAGWLSFREFLPRCAYRATVEISLYVGEKYRRRALVENCCRKRLRAARSWECTRSLV